MSTKRKISFHDSIMQKAFMNAEGIHDQQFSDKAAVSKRSYLTGDHSKSNAKLASGYMESSNY